MIDTLVNVAAMGLVALMAVFCAWDAIVPPCGCPRRCSGCRDCLALRVCSGLACLVCLLGLWICIQIVFLAEGW